ncbi:serine protease [Staphylococcus simiae]|nr:serine protease [Staphylococcus simiae]
MQDQNNRHKSLTLPEEQQLKRQQHGQDKVLISNQDSRQDRHDNTNKIDEEELRESEEDIVHNDNHKSAQTTDTAKTKDATVRAQQFNSDEENARNQENQHNKSLNADKNEKVIAHNKETTPKLDSDSQTKQQQNNNNKKSTSTTKAQQRKATQSSEISTNKYGSDSKDMSQYSEIIKRFWHMYWPKIVILVGIIILIVILNAIFNHVNDNDKGMDNSQQSKDAYTTTMKNANNTVKSVVSVENNTEKDTSIPKDKNASEDEIGSGVIYKKSGDTVYIVTNAHVVGKKDQQKITFANNKSVIGKVLGKDKWSDLAVIKATSKDPTTKEITFGDSNHIVLGEPIIVVGNPLGVDFKSTVTEGIISGLNRNVPIDFDKDNKYDMLMKAFQIDASVNPGNSGGAVVNREGKLIGIISLKIDMPNVEGMSFALPVNEVQRITHDLETKGKIKYPDIGMTMTNIADLSSYERQSIKLPQSINNGVVVKNVDSKSLAQKAGLKKDDVIVELDDKLIEDDLHFKQVLFSHKYNLKPLTAKIYRDGNEKEITLKLK